MVYANYRAARRLPSANFLVPMAALYVWWLPITRQSEFYFFMAPLFHAVQYLPFVYRVEDSRRRAAGRARRRSSGWWPPCCWPGGWRSSWCPAPSMRCSGPPRRSGISFFVIAAMLFINIHHYFIDNVIWRFADPEVRSHLLNLGFRLPASGSRLPAVCHRCVDAVAGALSGTSIRMVPSCREVMNSSPSRLRLMCRSPRGARKPIVFSISSRSDT